MTPKEGRSFARQSAWMMAATLMGGMAMMFVHTFVSKRCGPQAYAEFKTLLSTFYVVAAVGGGFWMVFGQRTAAAITEVQRVSVGVSARRAVGLILGLGVLAGGVLYRYQADLVALWKLNGAGGLWATWMLGVLTLWISVARGIVQGRQAFGVLGWMAILDGLGRLGIVVVLVTVIGGGAGSVIAGAGVGCAAALMVGLWSARDLWLLRPGSGAEGGGETGTRLAGLLPLSLSAAALQMFQQYDNLFWQGAIPTAVFEAWNLGATYSPAQTVGFAITQFTVPLALVMMPRIARSVAKGEKSDTLKLALMCTGGMGMLAAGICTVFPRLPLQIMFFNRPENWAASPLVPWFAWSMVLFTVANVLLNDLFARRRLGVVAAVVAVSVAYVAVLNGIRPYLLTLSPSDAYRTALKVLCGSTALLLAVSAVAVWQARRADEPSLSTAPQ